MLGCKGKSCNQFHICRVLLEYVIAVSASAVTKMSILLNTAKIGKFKQLSTYVNRGAIYGGKSNFILTFLLEGCPMYQIYQVQSQKPGFWGYSIVNELCQAKLSRVS